METKNEASVKVEIRIQVPGGEGEMKEVLRTESCLTKADAGKALKEQLYIHILPSPGGDYGSATVSVNYGCLTKADAGFSS